MGVKIVRINEQVPKILYYRVLKGWHGKKNNSYQNSKTTKTIHKIQTTKLGKIKYDA